MITEPFTVKRIQGNESAETFQAIAQLHRDLIHGDILPLLNKFLGNLYREIAKSKWGAVYRSHPRIMKSFGLSRELQYIPMRLRLLGSGLWPAGINSRAANLAP